MAFQSAIYTLLKLFTINLVKNVGQTENVKHGLKVRVNNWPNSLYVCL